MNTLLLNNTLNVVASSCEAAEEAIRQQIEQKHQGADEEFITRFWHGEFKFALKRATAAGDIARAFRDDLTVMLGGVLDSLTLDELSADIVADSRLHKRSVEAKTGGDFGLVIARPSIQLTEYSVTIEMVRQGLLCQAKLRHGEKWGSLTKNQRKALKDRTSFVALVLYSYSDEELTHLNEIEWQPSKGATVREMSSWLKNALFPSVLSTRNMVQSLGDGEIGTSDQVVIDDLIVKSNVPLVEITIGWPDGRRPDSEIQVIQSQQQLQHVLVNNY